MDNFYKITVYCPVQADAFRKFLAGDKGALTSDANVAALCDILCSDPAASHLGNYRGVLEITPNIESFTPAEGAAPKKGAIGRRETLPSTRITTFIPGGTEAAHIKSLIDRLVAAHPWEHPVIELISDVKVYVP